MIISTTGTGYSATAPTEWQTFMRRSNYVANNTKTGIVFCHSWGATLATGMFPTPSISSSMPSLLRWFAECGWPIVGADLGGDTFGNDTGIARVGEARSYLQTTLGAKTGPVILMAWSAGGANAMAYARANPANVAALVLFQPASDLQDVVTNNRGGAAAAVNAAYAGGYSNATYGATHNPVVFASSLSGIPTFIAYATDDTTVIPSSAQTVVTGIGASCTAISGTGGHGDGYLSSLVGTDGSCGVISRWLAARSL